MRVTSGMLIFFRNFARGAGFQPANGRPQLAAKIDQSFISGLPASPSPPVAALSRGVQSSDVSCAGFACRLGVSTGLTPQKESAPPDAFGSSAAAEKSQ